MTSIVGLIGILSMVAFLFGVANVIYPIRKLHIRSRKRAGVVCGVSAIVFMIAVAATPSKTDATINAADSGLDVADDKNDASERKEQPETAIEISAVYGRWAATKQQNSCTESVMEYTAQQVTLYNFNEGMRENNIEPVIARLAAEYRRSGDVIFVKTTGKGGSGYDAIRVLDSTTFEHLKLLRSDGSTIDTLAVAAGQETLPPFDTISAGEPTYRMKKCGAEADQFIASFGAARQELDRAAQDARQMIESDSQARLIYDLAWMTEVDKKCDFLEKNYLGNRFNEQLFSVTAGTNDKLRPRFERVIYDNIIRQALDDGKATTCSSSSTRTRFSGLWEQIAAVR